MKEKQVYVIIFTFLISLWIKISGKFIKPLDPILSYFDLKPETTVYFHVRSGTVYL